MTDRLTVVLPAISEDQISTDLRYLTEKLEAYTGGDNVQGLLGGRYGYGVDFKNDTFEMHPFYWGDCICGFAEKQDDFFDELQHEDHCYQTELTNALIAEGFKLNEWGGPADDDEDEEHFTGRERLSKFYSFKSAKAKELSVKHGFDPEVGIYVHCNCSYTEHADKWHEENTHTEECPTDWPNFHHYASGIKIEWYKYIGRDMDFNKTPSREEWDSILQSCLWSLR